MIREARLDDLDELERLESVCFPEPWTRGLIQSELDAPSRINLVWTEDRRIAGYVLSMQIFDDLHVNKIGALPEVRGRGVASELMIAVAAIALDRGCERISLEVREANDAARSFYESLGFEVEYTRRAYYPSGENALVMSRPILRGRGPLSPPGKSSPPEA